MLWVFREKLHCVSTNEEEETDRVEPFSYTLTLDMLLMVLQAHQYTCTLCTSVSFAPRALPAGMNAKVLYQAELTVVQGQITHCLLRDREHAQPLLTGQKAFAMLAQAQTQTLTWVVQPAEQSVSRSSASAHQTVLQEHWSAHTSLQLVKAAEQKDVASLPHHMRRVVLLINGTRTLADVCRILHWEPQQLLPLLDVLRDEGWIS